MFNPPSMKEEKEKEDKIIDSISSTAFFLWLSIVIAVSVYYSNIITKLDRIEQKQDKIIEQIQKSHE